MRHTPHMRRQVDWTLELTIVHLISTLSHDTSEVPSLLYTAHPSLAPNKSSSVPTFHPSHITTSVAYSDPSILHLPILLKQDTPSPPGNSPYYQQSCISFQPHSSHAACKIIKILIHPNLHIHTCNSSVSSIACIILLLLFHVYYLYILDAS